MTHEDPGQLRVLGAHIIGHSTQVVDDLMVAPVGGLPEGAVRQCPRSVATVVAGHHEPTSLCQTACELVVASSVLGEPVHQLDESTWLAVGPPDEHVNLRTVIGREGDGVHGSSRGCDRTSPCQGYSVDASRP